MLTFFAQRSRHHLLMAGAMQVIFDMGRIKLSLASGHHFFRIKATIPTMTKITTSIIHNPPHPPMAPVPQLPIQSPCIIVITF